MKSSTEKNNKTSFAKLSFTSFFQTNKRRFCMIVSGNYLPAIFKVPNISYSHEIVNKQTYDDLLICNENKTRLKTLFHVPTNKKS